MAKSIKLKDNTFIDSSGVSHNRVTLKAYLQSLLDNVIHMNYKDNTEIATNEYKNGKRVYAKKLVFTTTLSGSETTTIIAHGITGMTDIWIDMGNSYFKSVGTTMLRCPLPVLGYYGNFSDRLYVMCDNTNLYFYHDTGWGTAWEKIILVKYTKD